MSTTWQRQRTRPARAPQHAFPERAERRAYTLIELICVIAIIGILVALLLPAVQAVREAARRFSCANNLMQLSLAVCQYEMQHQVFPAGTLQPEGPIRSEALGHHHNWITAVLPYLEQRNAARHIDRTVGVYAPANLPVRRLNLPVLRCPSSGFGKAYSEYAGVHHELEAPIDADNHGVFFLNSRVHVEDVRDGTSQTIFLGEKHTITGDLGWMSGTRATLRNTGVPINWRPDWNRRWHEYPPQDYPPGVEPQTSELTGDELLRVLFGEEGAVPPWSLRHSYSATPALLPPFQRPADPLLAVGGFGSFHSGGAQFAFGDGSIQFLSETVDPAVFVRLGHRADQDLLNDEY
jgi:prepilin-type N-terminal cleavage/methylation domain-containing protein/prepilin-type processing-associated H-X9-DG protein